MSVDITLQDGVFGFVTGAQEGKALITGYCSKGVPGQAYYIGASTDIPEVLGAGPLVDRLQDVFSVTDDAVVIAVSVSSNDIDETRGSLTIDTGGISGEKALSDQKNITDIGDGVFALHKQAYGMTVNAAVDDNGTVTTSYLQKGVHYQYDDSSGQFALALDVTHVPANVTYESTIDGDFSGSIEFIDNRMTIPSDAINLQIEVEIDAVMASSLPLIEGEHYSRDNGTITLLSTKELGEIRLGTYTLVGTIEERYPPGKDLVCLSIMYFYSLFAQGNKEIALPKYVANVKLATAGFEMPNNTYTVSYDPSKQCNVLQIVSPMPESVIVTWESINNDINITKSRESSPELQVLGAGKAASVVTIQFNLISITN